MTAGWYPNAIAKPIPPATNDPAITPRLAILHVDAGNASSLYNLFKANQSNGSGIEAHLFVKADGTVEQYRSIYFQADANYLANDFAVSIETQGYGDGEWTREQIAAIKTLLLWLHTEAGTPLIKAETWDGSGVGYHTQFGAPGKWTPVAKSCPGPQRIKQFATVLVPWMTSQATAPTELSRERARLTAWRKRLGNSRPRVRAAIDAFLKGTPKR
jgi:hypothetical protein